jgi:hypothetical protein
VTTLRFLFFCSASVALTLAVAACGGGGEDAPPAPPPPMGLQPTLASIQANIFTPTCAVSGCHSGPGAVLGLNLEAGQSAANLINVPSFYGGMVVRVIPGNPDDSFLIHKLQGNQAFGERMPLNGPYFQQVTIDVIRQWIQDGALP